MPHSILVVDDEPSVLRFCENSLTSHGYRVLTVPSAEEALQIRDCNFFDLVLMDIRLSSRAEGGMDGVECVAELRGRGYCGIICMMTGDSSPRSLLLSVSVGANCYYLKGSEEDLVGAVQQLFSGASPYRITLNSLGLTRREIELMLQFDAHGYPRIGEFATSIGVESGTISTVFHRIRNKLGLESQYQLVNLMTAVSTYGLLDERKVG